MHCRLIIAVVVLASASPLSAQTLDALRADQVSRLRNYVVDAIRPSGLVRDSLVLQGSSFHPATPDAAGFALVALSAIDQWDQLKGTSLLPDAEQRVINVLTAHAGQKPGVTPARSPNGHFIHFMDLNTGAPAPCCWDDSYSPISTALLVAGAQFAKNHFAGNATIASLADQLTGSVDFNAAIHPSLSGAIYRDMLASGTGDPGALTLPWNEYMLVESLALRQSNNARALAVEHLWLDADNLPKKSHPDAGNIPTLTDNPGLFAPAFWVQQMHFFNGDFRHSEELEQFYVNQKLADKFYASQTLDEPFRYGLTAGVSPGGYQADRIKNHPGDVFSPEAVAAWGDMDTLLQFYATQPAAVNDPRYRYGMLRVSADQPTWLPFDAGLVDHLFLLFGIVESVDADFFADRVFGARPGDYNRDGGVDGDDYVEWRASLGSSLDRGPDGNFDGTVDAADYVLWRKVSGSSGSGGATVPESGGLTLAASGAILVLSFRRQGSFNLSIFRRKT